MREYHITREGAPGTAADDDSIADEIKSLVGGTYTLTVSDPEEDLPLPEETELQKLERLSQEAHNKAENLEHLMGIAKDEAAEAYDRWVDAKVREESNSQAG